MKIMFVGDLHLGKSPAHSTRDSALRHAMMVNFQLNTLRMSQDVDMVVQLGDVFDSYSVSNTSFVRGAKALDQMDYALGGNHDYSHNSYNQAALADLQEVTKAEIILSPSVVPITFPERSVVLGYLHFIPYMPTQENFLEAISNLEPLEGSVPNIVCLHTNMYPEGFQGAEVENNLSEALARSVYDKGFDLIVSGHEHNASTKAGVEMIGSIYPFTFGDLEDKSVMIVDLEDNCSMQRVPTWEREAQYLNISAEEFLAVDDMDALGFIELTGYVMPEDVLPVAKKMRYLFKASTVMCIKNSLKVQRSVDVDERREVLTDWKTFVEGELDNPRRCELFRELLV